MAVTQLRVNSLPPMITCHGKYAVNGGGSEDTQVSAPRTKRFAFTAG